MALLWLCSDIQILKFEHLKQMKLPIASKLVIKVNNDKSSSFGYFARRMLHE